MFARVRLAPRVLYASVLVAQQRWSVEAGTRANTSQQRQHHSPSWVCHACGWKNSGIVSVCGYCNSSNRPPNQSSAKVPPPQVNNNTEGDGPRIGRDLSVWSCLSCRMKNPCSRNLCFGCGQRRFTRTVFPNGVAPQQPKKNPQSSDDARAVKSDWECPDCLAVNPSTADTCAACGNKKK